MTTPTVLLADENQDSRTILGAVFRHCGYAVIEAPDGPSALQLARDRHVALVVSELYVPVGDAPCLVEVLKRSAETAAIPVIVVTSRVMPADRQHAHDVGCDTVLGKPFEFQELIRLADELVRAARSTIPAPLGSSAGARHASGAGCRMHG